MFELRLRLARCGIGDEGRFNWFSVCLEDDVEFNDWIESISTV